MLEITVDVFSGRPDPSWILPDEADTREILKAIEQDREMVEPIGSGYQGLGFRGILIRFTQDGLAVRYGLPPYFQIANRASKNVAKGLAVADRLVRGMTNCKPRTIHPHSPTSLDAALQQALLNRMQHTPVMVDRTQPDLTGLIVHALPGSVWFSMSAPTGSQPCWIETRPFDPDFWNDPYHIWLNNCYNYATNRRTDTLAQPGEAAGKPFPALACQEVTEATLADGGKRRGDCRQDTEKPRWLMALVIDPGVDFHWYRLHLEGFWGHKPGRTAARNTDDNGHVVLSPEFCARSTYTEFCGYFYAPAGMNVQ